MIPQRFSIVPQPTQPMFTANLPITRPLRGGTKSLRLDMMYAILLSGNFSPSMQSQVGGIVKGMMLAAQGRRR